MLDMGKYTQSKWMKAADVDPNQILTIQKAYEHEFERDNSKKPVIEFLESDQAVVCNKTRITALVDAFGTDGTKWAGKRVKLSTAPTSMGDTIVVKSAEPAAAGPEVDFA